MTGVAPAVAASAPAGAPGEPFDLLGPLPEGTTVLEASAGTGKTFTIAALVARYVAEGVVRMDELLVVSFSRESTRELRERVRERLVQVRDVLAADGTPRAGAPPDDVCAFLADVDPVERAVRRRRLEDALASFDAATVTTTHGFCQQVLLTLGAAGGTDPRTELVEDVGDLVREVADDLYLRKWGVDGAGPPELSRAAFGELASAVVRDPATPLLPPPGTDGVPGLRARVAAAVRREVDRRKRRDGVVDYDDLLLRLDAALQHPATGEAARRRLRRRYRVVLVDEFQDTDPVQWSILRRPFHGHRTLVLIGDPKQAIYGFRGADVHAYLEARAVAGTVRTLTTSYRSDAALLDGLAGVFRGAALGDPRIRVVPVAAQHTGRLVALPGDAAPVRLRVVPREGRALSGKGLVRTDDARRVVAADLTTEVVALLAGGATVRPRDGGAERPLVPGDVAVLVRTNKEARLVSDALRRASVPVVVTGRTSVFTTDAAAEWQLLLEALEQPHRTTRVRRLALGCFGGLDATDLASSGDAVADELGLRLRGWARVLDERGVAALFEAVSMAGPLLPGGSAGSTGSTGALQERLLGREEGERLLTDLRHIAQALHEAALEGQLGLTALVTWLRRRREEGARDAGLERSRRLDSDADAVQVVTVHTSKGLEFPVVLVPFAWNQWSNRDVPTAVFHDGGRRVRDVGGPGSPDWGAHVAQHTREEVDDELRLTYVALTRAQSALLLWWVPGTGTATAPLHRLLVHDLPDPADPAAADPGGVAPTSLPVPSDAEAMARFTARAAMTGGGLAIEEVSPRRAASWSPPASATPRLSVAELTRPLDTAWRRTSYSALTAAAHAERDSERLGSEAEVELREDERDVTTAEPSSAGGPGAGLRSVPSAWDALPGGTRFGTLVHAALEHLEDAADPAAVREAVAVQVARHAPGVDVGELTDALVTALATPLGPQAGGLAWRDVAAADRLPELEFELPLAGGDEPVVRGRDSPVLADLVPLWRQHGTGPFAEYADALAELSRPSATDPAAAPAPLRGYLTGSIDAVLRVRDAAVPGGVRYAVLDWKTNRLGGLDEPLTAWHYRPEAMHAAMVDAHYPLQALLYQVALHRYLRWRQPGYDPEVHLGGALYLFLRGMSGPGVTCADGSAPGVVGWQAPAALVTATSDLLAGRR